MAPTTTHDEQQYLALVSSILARGEERSDRTGTGTRALFAPPQMRFSLRNAVLPLLTTKRVFWRGVVEELLWFIRGDTNAKHLSERGVKIWDANGSREFLDSVGLSHRSEGDLGPIYSMQWRHFGAKYIDCNTDYTGQGVDQLRNVIDKIKTTPHDRRMIISAWNPPDIPLSALPPCHILMHFYVSTARPDAPAQLSCLLYQRSADVGLGVPFNIASYALLTHMIAHVTGLETGEFIHVLGDAHIYNDHIEALKTQILREPRTFPTLRIKRQVADIDDFTVDDFEVLNYEPHGKIEMKMSA